MDWLNIFFGWLIKKQYETTMLDGIMFLVELVLLTFIVCVIYQFKNKR